MTKKILLMGHGMQGRTNIAMQALKEKHGDEIVLVTPQEAQEQGLIEKDFANIPTFTIKANPYLENITLPGNEKSGQEKRRDRRKNKKKK